MCMVVADSCYSGSLTRASLTRLSTGMTESEWVARLRALGGKRSRTALTSGGLQPTLDSGGGQNSVFAKAFLAVLAENDGLLEGQRVHEEVQARVTYAAEQVRFEQVPEYAPIRFAGPRGRRVLLRAAGVSAAAAPDGAGNVPTRHAGQLSTRLDRGLDPYACGPELKGGPGMPRPRIAPDRPARSLLQ